MTAAGGLWVYAGPRGFGVLVKHGGTYWISVKNDDARISPSMRLALQGAPPVRPGRFEWRQIAPGFETAELPVLAESGEVDRILLARIDPASFRFEVRNAPAKNKTLDQWMTSLGAALVINGSYYSRQGTPDTPLVSNGTRLGPEKYDAKAGAFVASANSVGIRDLADEDWRSALSGADNAMVSYPLLVSKNPERHPVPKSRWLANRSFVGQDKSGWIVLGTTTDAFFSLSRLAEFLRDAPLDLTSALNLDGGPVACQGISLNGFERRASGQWELQADDNGAKLLTWPYGTMARMPIVLAVFPR
ncbi:phosphodiester glycosidase family protein [Bradyrhizobium sp. NP1]|uniref:phosphodiester glycosidase family protein n=1 Tax=Bradyrhizobium sp. NP1 TaxID=3049772 RepID=UPI0025A62EDD|nr:phosphodiester glycosidase family protein [Bradyrhizobium sp. NP1]WJR78843.1 phosphodiester glycosidase family protein [Bradyrhizobium sp. NP1]